MLLKNVILRNSDGFQGEVLNWANFRRINHEVFNGKESLFDLIDSILVIHEDHNISKDNRNLLDQIKAIPKPAHIVDINATMTASTASVKFWLENNRPENVLIVGDDSIIKNSRLGDFLGKLADLLSE
jgi:hypothetical protein